MSDKWEKRGQDRIFRLPEDYKYAANLNYLSSAKGECLYRIQDQNIYKALPLGQNYAVFEISYEEEDHRLMLRFADRATPPHLPLPDLAVQYVTEWLDLTTDLTPFYAMAQTDDILRLPVQRYRGLRTIGIPDLFEAMSWGIIGQQINLTFAYTLKRRFVEAFGSCLEWENRRYWMFPTSRRIASLAIQDLTPLQISVRKAEYLIGVAKRIEEGVIAKEKLQLAGFKEAEKRLMDIRGIGAWTANYVCMRCLRFPEAVPVGDAGLHNALKQVLHLPGKPTESRIKEIFSKWSGWESYATFYLWRLLY